MSSTLNINQTEQTPVKGDLDLQIASTQTISGILSVNQATPLVAGTPVKFDSAVTVGGTPQFIKAESTALADGFIKRTLQASSFSALDVIEVVGDFGPVMWMVASGTITPGAQVENTTDELSVQTPVSAGKVRGKAIEYATDGNLIRIMITAPMAFAS